VAVIGSLLLMKLPPYIPHPIKKKLSSDLVEGFSYLKNTPAISIILLMLGLTSLLVLPYNTLLPVFAKVIFKGDAALSVIMSCISGCLAGTSKALIIPNSTLSVSISQT